MLKHFAKMFCKCKNKANFSPNTNQPGSQNQNF